MKFLNKINNPEQLKRLSRTDLPTLAGKIPRIIENVCQGGFGSAVLECLCDEGINKFSIERIGIADTFVEYGPQIFCAPNTV